MISIEDILIHAIQAAVKKLGFDSQEPILLEIPREDQHGDLATNVAMRLAKSLKQPPLSIAQRIARELEVPPLQKILAKIEAKPPGFINFFLSLAVLHEAIPVILTEQDRYGASNLGEGRRALLEFVSANPTGPLSVAHGRQAAVGDALTNILQFTGHEVSREYYLNDVGNQMNLLAQSIWVRYRELLGEKPQFPQGGYKGRYVVDIAEELHQKVEGGKEKLQEWAPEVCDELRRFGMGKILEGIRRDLEDFGVHFDTWFSQGKLEASGKVQQALNEVKKKGYIYEEEGAIWFKSSVFGDDKDRVLVKSEGSFTYLAPDIAYHEDKLSRGYEILIDIWGPDHHGYVPRMKAAIEALGYPRESLVVLIVQLTTLYEGKRKIPMSTREGEFVTLREVIDSVGKDVARFFFLMRKIDAHLDFDLELARKESMENPVYYIQYAHARICSILEFGKGRFPRGAPFSLLTTPEEIKCLKLLRQFPASVQLAAQLYEPYYLVPYLQRLAESFHQFYHQHRVVTEDRELTQARLALVDGVRIAIANGLRLLGVSAPEKM